MHHMSATYCVKKLILKEERVLGAHQGIVPSGEVKILTACVNTAVVSKEP